MLPALLREKVQYAKVTCEALSHPACLHLTLLAPPPFVTSPPTLRLLSLLAVSRVPRAFARVMPSAWKVPDLTPAW